MEFGEVVCSEKHTYHRSKRTKKKVFEYMNVPDLDNFVTVIRRIEQNFRKLSDTYMVERLPNNIKGIREAQDYR